MKLQLNKLFQGKWESFEACDDVHVLAGSLKLFLRELPDPLIPYDIHSDCVKAAMGLGIYQDDIAQSLDVGCKNYIMSRYFSFRLF